MNEEEKYFDYSMIPGKELNLNQSINDKEPIISIITGYYNAKNILDKQPILLSIKHFLIGSGLS